jgi:hypothetical protein
VEHRLGPVLGLDDDVGLGEAALDIASLLGSLADQLAAAHRLVRIE